MIPLLKGPVDSSLRSESTLVSTDLQEKRTKKITKEPETERRRLLQRRNQTKKRVEFKASVSVRKIGSCRYYKDEEREAYWVSPEESVAVRKSAIRTIKSMAKGIDVDQDPNDCSRGLESKVPKVSKAREKRISDIIHLVLLEQKVQFEEGIFDDDLLGNNYGRFCAESALNARKRGEKDEAAARKLAVEPPYVLSCVGIALDAIRSGEKDEAVARKLAVEPPYVSTITGWN